MEYKTSKPGNGKCICCDKQLETCGPENSDVYNIPGGAIVFKDCGNYGSAINDSAYDGHYFEILVCDECLTKKRDCVHEFDMVGHPRGR
jgi:hypothetical protein